MMTLLAHHHSAPEPQGPPVVLLHGFTSSAEADFSGWAEHLARSGRSSLAIELPGHGGNAPLDQAMGTEAIVAEILATIDVHLPGIFAPELDVIGYSLGARLAWELPARQRRIRRLVLGGLSPTEPFSGVTAEALLSAVEQPAPVGGPTGAGESEAATQNPILGMLAMMISAPGCDTRSLARLAEGLGA